MNSLAHSSPLIWFSQDRFLSDTKDCNCDCACSVYSNPPTLYGQKFNEDGFYTCQECIISQELGDYFLISSPTGRGQFAVLNSPASELLDIFKVPTRPKELSRNKIAGLSEFRIERLSRLFWALGFIESPDRLNGGHSIPRPDVLTAWLHITNQCNLSCSYCYVSKSSENMDLDIAKQAIHTIVFSAEKHDFKIVRLKYAGGEPSSKIEDVLTIHDCATELTDRANIKLDAVLLSNGVYIPSWAINELAYRNIKIMISLDGIGDAHDNQRHYANGKGSFSNVIKTIEILKSRRISPHVSVTVTNRNLAGLRDLVTYLLEENLIFGFNYYRSTKTSPKDLILDTHETISAMREVFGLIENNLPKESLLSSLVDRVNLNHTHRYTCGVGINYVTIDHKGFIAQCQMDFDNPIGHVGEGDIIDLIKNAGQKTNLAVDEKENCKVCLWRYWCAGGCPLASYNNYGRFDTSAPTCAIYKDLIPEVLRLEGLRLLKYTKPWSP